MTLNKYVYVIFDKWNDEPVTTHRHRSAWATPAAAERARLNWKKRTHRLNESYDARFVIRKAVMAVLP